MESKNGIRDACNSADYCPLLFSFFKISFHHSHRLQESWLDTELVNLIFLPPSPPLHCARSWLHTEAYLFLFSFVKISFHPCHTMVTLWSQGSWLDTELVNLILRLICFCLVFLKIVSTIVTPLSHYGWLDTEVSRRGSGRDDSYTQAAPMGRHASTLLFELSFFC